MLENVLKKRNMSVYQCAKMSDIPYTTLLELVKGKTKIEKCSAETVYRLSKTLNISMEELLKDSVEYRFGFEAFKSNVCHEVKDNGDIDFIVKTLKSDDIRRYWDKKWYQEAFYLLAMVDYLSRMNDIPLCTNYDDIRACSLKKPIYPKDVEMTSKLNFSLDIKKKCQKEAIPEFLKFNIIESNIRNVY